MKAWYCVLITNVNPYLNNDKCTKLNHNETLIRWKYSNIRIFEKEKPICFSHVFCLFNFNLIRGHESTLIKGNLTSPKEDSYSWVFFWKWWILKWFKYALNFMWWGWSGKRSNKILWIRHTPFPFNKWNHRHIEHE